MYNFLLMLQGVGVIVSLFLICFIVREKNYFNNKYLLLTMICSFVQAIALCFEFLSSTEEVALLAVKIQFIGSCFSTATMIYFVFEICEIKISKMFYWVSVGINAFILLSVVTSEYHNLFYTDYFYVQEEFYNHIVFKKGMLYYLFIAIRLFLIAFLMYKTTLKLVKCDEQEFKKYLNISIVSAIPAVFILLNALNISEIPDFTALSFIVASIMFVIIIYKYRVFDFVQSARETIIQNMLEAIIFVDQNYRYIESNLAAKDVFPRLKYMKKGDKISKCSIVMSEMFKKGEKNDFELKGKFYECHISKIYNDDREIEGYAACVFDVTESHYYMEQLIQMKDESDAANRAKSDFLANVSHEIRTPMNAIIGLSEIVLRGELNEDQRGNIRSILNSSKSLLTIINNILDLSKIESGKFEIIDDEYNLGNVLNEVYNIIKVRLYDRPIDFTVDIPNDLPSILFGDYMRIKEILFNILGNAVKFTREGFIKLYIEWRFNEKNDEYINVIMKVSDSGIGIKKEDMKKLFETYNQVDTRKNRSISGTGLGLAISKNLAEMMGGYISVESVYGKGSTFTISVKQKVKSFEPINKDDICKDDSGDFDEDKNSFLNEKIVSIPQARVLIVDDVSVNLQVSKGLMEPYNMKVDVALNGAEAIEMIKEKDYDLVFMDHMMPNMDGVDVTRIIRSLDDEKYKKLPIIALTANALTSSREFFMENGFNGFLAKPIDLKQLNKVLYDYLPVKSNIQEKIEKQFEKDESSKINIKGIDSESGISNIGGKVDAYYKILKSYLKETLEMYKEFDYLIDNDIDIFRIKIHGLKSSSANIGAVFISEKARMLEMAAKDMNMEYIKNNINSFYKELEELLENIRIFLENLEKNNDDDKEILEALNVELIKKIKSAAENFDIEEMEKAMAAIKENKYNEKISEFVENLDGLIENFEYTKCIELIDNYENNLK